MARFLESQGFKEEALAVSSDPDHRFELAVDLRKMDVAHAVLLDPEVSHCYSTHHQYTLTTPSIHHINKPSQQSLNTLNQPNSSTPSINQ